MVLLLRLAGRPGRRRVLTLRRAAAGALALLALVLAIAPGPAAGAVPVVVAAADLASGSTLAAEALAVRRFPPDLVPAGALADPADAAGRVLVGAARAGEPLTDARLTGAGPLPGDAAAVPVRLADPDVAALLLPGTRVDVVTLGERAGEPLVLAPDAQVLTVVGPERTGSGGGPLVLVAVPRATATRVAAAALADQVAVTLR
jgi:pilus assembly protein CpaB